MTDKIIYFTAGRTATTQEKADIEEIRALCVAPFEVAVRNPIDSPNYGAGPEAAVYVAGTVPDEAPYDELPVFDPDAPPVTLPSTQAVVTNGQKITGVTGTGTVANIVVNPTTKAITINLTSS